MECSLCSVFSYLIGCVHYAFHNACEYPLVLFAFGLLMTTFLFANTNVNTWLDEIAHKSGNFLKGRGYVHTPDVIGFYDYSAEYGPHTWRVAENINQSPINIIEDTVQIYPIHECLTWTHYDDLPTSITLENNGRTVILRACFSGNRPTISGADLLASYSFFEMTFRWALTNEEGSEHMMNYRKFPLEIQVAHRTGNDDEKFSPYDILMVSYMFEACAHNPYLEPLIQNLCRVRKAHCKVSIPPFPLSYLCFQFRSNFYSYGGSMTEPPCYQGVEWFVFPEPLSIGQRQLNEFRKLYGSDGTVIIRNARPVQPLLTSRCVNFNQFDPCAATSVPPVSIPQTDGNEMYDQNEDDLGDM